LRPDRRRLHRWARGMGTANRQWEGCQWYRQSEQGMKMLEEKDLLWQNRAERENPGARASMQRLDSRA
jgi:hypothetical protein